MMGNSVCQRGRYPNGRKRRWTQAKKNVAKKVWVEEWLSIARQWKHKKEIEEVKSTTPTHGGVGKWGEELPWELWEFVLGNLSTVDRLSCVTSMKVIMERYEKGSKLAALREEAREEMQIAWEEHYE